MNFSIPTVEDIVTKYQGTDLENPEAAKAELMKLTKDELADKLMQATSHRSGTVQELAKAILQDEDMIAANYTVIADAIKVMMPSAKTSSKSIASYVSKKREEWNLPDRIRVSTARPKKTETEVPEVDEVDETESTETE